MRSYKRLPHAGVQRVGVTLTNCPIVDSVGNEVCGLKPHLIVHVDLSNRFQRRAFRGAMHSLGLQTVGDAVSVVGDRHTFDVMGSPEALESLVSCPAVVGYEFPTNTRVGCKGQGGGPEKVRSKPSKGKGAWHGRDEGNIGATHADVAYTDKQRMLYGRIA
jgi:hypothetical protein